MNKQQRAYAQAKANLLAAEDAANDAEREYIKAAGIVNRDGKPPKHLYCMDDVESFDLHIEALGRIYGEAGLDEKFNAAAKRLQEAEDELIEYGLSITPPGVRETLRSRVKGNWSLREMLIDKAFRLDAKTVR